MRVSVEAGEGSVRQRRHRVRRLALPGDQRRLRGHGRRVRGDQGAGHRPVREAVPRRRVHRPRLRLPPSRRERRAAAPGRRASASSSPTGRPRSRFARTLPGVDPARVAIWGFSLSGGHVFRVAARNPQLAAAIAQTPHADGPAAARNAARHQKPLAMLRLTGRGLARRRRRPGSAVDAAAGAARRSAGHRRDAHHAGWPRRRPGAQPGQQVPGLAAGGRRPLRAAHRLLPARAATRPACGARCWSWSATRTSRRLAGPAVRAAQRAPRGPSSSGCRAGTTSRSWAATSGRRGRAVLPAPAPARRHDGRRRRDPRPREPRRPRERDRAVRRDDRLPGHRRRRAGDRAAARAA